MTYALRISTLFVTAACGAFLGSAQTVAEAENLAYERLADLAVKLPPEI